jgi:hypothetical protein
MAQGRDNSNPVSELIDLYQLTYDPRVLAVLAPRLDVWLYGTKDKGGSALMSFWGHPLHNVVLFHGMEDVSRSLQGLMAKHHAGQSEARAVKGQATAGPWKSGGFAGDPSLVGRARVAGHVWDFSDYSAEAHSMATILDPQSPYAADIVFDSIGARARAQALARIEPLVLYPVADNLRPIPRMLYALMHSTRRELAGVLGDAQSMPATWTGTPLRCVIREDRDQEIKAHIIGVVAQANGVEVQAFGPDGVLISRTTVPPGRHSSFAMTLPEDGKTGQYVLFIERRQVANDLSLPVTALPEVFLLREWTTFGGGARPSQYFTRSPGADPCELSIGGEATRVFAADKRTLLGFTNKDKKDATVRIGPEGAWICGGGGFSSYSADKSPVIVSTSPERWFVPNSQSLALKPAP